MGRNPAAVIITIMVLLYAICSPAWGADVCNGKYRNGGRPTPDDIARILTDHAAWLPRKTERKDNALWIAVNDHDDSNQANFCNANLAHAQLRHAVLNGANLQGANLSGANLRNAQLVAADFSGAIARGASFSHAELVDANFRNADVTDADFSWALLAGSNMEGANIASARFALFDIVLAGRKDNLPNESTLRATGWIRSVSGIQSIVSVYLLAIWALTYFARPFE